MAGPTEPMAMVIPEVIMETIPVRPRLSIDINPYLLWKNRKENICHT
jgi:hypothetical protein